MFSSSFRKSGSKGSCGKYELFHCMAGARGVEGCYREAGLVLCCVVLQKKAGSRTDRSRPIALVLAENPVQTTQQKDGEKAGVQVDWVESERAGDSRVEWAQSWWRSVPGEIRKRGGGARVGNEGQARKNRKGRRKTHEKKKAEGPHLIGMARHTHTQTDVRDSVLARMPADRGGDEI